MHYVYIIYSASNDVYYKGYTTQPKVRIAQHNNNEGRYTAGKGPWKLVFLQQFNNETDARKRERQLKRQHRQYLEWCVEQNYNIANSVG
jgi:putative endonuclease